MSTKKQKRVYLLRTCNKDMTSYNGFRWPKKGKVVCPDWQDNFLCGNGLHGLINGEGDGSLLSWNDDAKWIVWSALKSEIITGKGELVNKAKAPRGTVLFVGNHKEATDFLMEKCGCADKAVVGCYKTGGDNAVLVGGDYSTLTGGNRSTLTGGHNSTLTGGHWSTLTGGYGSILNSGNWSTLIGRDNSTLTGGDYSTLTGGDGSTLTGGNNSTLIWKIWDGSRYRVYAFYVGENGIKPDTKYRWENGNMIEVK